MTLQTKLVEIRDLAIAALAELEEPVEPPENWSVPLDILAGEAGYLQNPALAECPNGDILCFYRRGTSHLNTGLGKIIMRRSTDRGMNWGDAEIFYGPSPSDKDCRGIVAGRDPVSGRVIVLFHESNSAGVIEKEWLFTSEDGLTWSQREFTEIYSLPNHHAFGSIVQTARGLSMMFYWFNKIYVIFSEDGGLTWGSLTTVFSSTTTAYTLTEPTLVAIDDDRLVIAMRDNKDGGQYFYSKSADGGFTWSAPLNARFTGQYPMPEARPPHMVLSGDNIYFAWDSGAPWYAQYLTIVPKEMFWTNPFTGWQRQVADTVVIYNSITSSSGQATAAEYGYITMLPMTEGVLRVFYDSKTGNDKTDTYIKVGSLPVAE